MGTAVGIHVPALASQEFIVLGQHKTVCHSIFAFTTYLWLNYSNTLKLPYIAIHCHAFIYHTILIAITHYCWPSYSSASPRTR